MSENPKWTDIAVAFFTVCLVGVAIWQGIIFRGQWQEMHSGGMDTHDLAVAAQIQAGAARAQADEAKAQVDELGESLKKTDALIEQATAQTKATQALAQNSKANLDVTRDSEHLAERAWIGVQTEMLSTYTAGKPIAATINLSNTGRSPALRISYTGNLSVLKKGEKPVFLYDWQLNDWSGVQPIPPQGGYQIFVSQGDRQVLYEENKTRIDRQQDIIWVWGTVEYEDIFSQRHTTRFCGYTLDTTSQPVKEGEYLKSCPEYSDMD